MPRLPQQARRRAKCRCVAADHEMHQAGGIGTSFSVPVGYVGAATGALACALAGKIIQRALRQNKAGAVTCKNLMFANIKLNMCCFRDHHPNPNKMSG